MIAINKEHKRHRKTARRPAAARPAEPCGPPAGMTLIEVLLALTIFSIGLLAVASMQVSSVTKNTSSRMNTMAVEYASDYMERLLGLGMDGKILDNAIDEDGDSHVDENDEVLTFPQLAAGGPYRPADFAGTDWDSDGAVDIPVNAEFNSLFDLSWTVTVLPYGTYMVIPGPAVPDDPSGPGVHMPRRIDLTVRWGTAGSGKMITLTSIKATEL